MMAVSPASWYTRGSEPVYIHGYCISCFVDGRNFVTTFDFVGKMFSGQQLCLKETLSLCTFRYNLNVLYCLQ